MHRFVWGLQFLKLYNKPEVDSSHSLPMCPPREGGPLVPPLPPLPPLRPLGGPLLLGGGGGPRLPLSNDGLVACSTLMAFPSKD